MYAIAVFSSRAETIKFSSSLKSIGVNAMVITTPKGLGASCSVSVKFYLKDINRAIYLLKKGNYGTFVQFFKLCTKGNNTNYEIISFM